MNMNQLNQKLNLYVNAFIEWIKNLPKTIQNSPLDEQIAWGVIPVGLIFMILGIIFL